MHRAGQLSKTIPRLCARNNGCSFAKRAKFGSSARLAEVQPNPRLDLDPSLETLLQDVDMALHTHSRRSMKSPHVLEILPSDGSFAEVTLEEHDQETHAGLPRKSPAALFGSQGMGHVILPLELQDTIRRLILDTNKSQVHSDAKRLFQKDTAEGSDGWDLQYDAQYRTRTQGVKHERRDGTAFASIALPAHYSAIYVVLDHVKRRLGSSWHVESVIDWGAGAGSGLWAALHTFQRHMPIGNSTNDLRIAQTTLKSFIGIEKRNGLSEIGRRLIQDIQPEHVSVSWQKGWHPKDDVPASDGRGVVALSAFLLTTLPDALARKKLIRQIWDSGANTIVLIDHSSKEGFEAIAAAREQLLKLGRKDLEAGSTSAGSGAHVVAPCPHDGACPLYHPGSTKLVCGYSQRIQRPEFVRRTKHSNVGHEDIGYSYVVIQRGSRPCPSITGLGRVGTIGQRALEREVLRNSLRELQVHDENVPDKSSHTRRSDISEAALTTLPDEGYTEEDIQEAIRLEAYQWPRLVFPPLKKSGHIILDGCTAEGKIMRMTIPKSQGKQAFYDARKSAWGDIFPHSPKNKPQERPHVLKLGSLNVPGADIGKRKSGSPRERNSYTEVAEQLRKERKKTQKSERRAREMVWDDD